MTLQHSQVNKFHAGLAGKRGEVQLQDFFGTALARRSFNGICCSPAVPREPRVKTVSLSNAEELSAATCDSRDEAQLFLI